MDKKDFVTCEHIASIQKEGDEIYLGRNPTIIDIGTKRLALCMMCDNTLRGHYIDNLRTIEIKVRT
jgi:hypothetical protein